MGSKSLILNKDRIVSLTVRSLDLSPKIWSPFWHARGG